MDNQILEVLEAVRQGQQELLARQEESLAFIRKEAEKSAQIRETALTLQRQAIARARRVGRFAFAGILICTSLAVYLIVKYNILWL